MSFWVLYRTGWFSFKEEFSTSSAAQERFKSVLEQLGCALIIPSDTPSGELQRNLASAIPMPPTLTSLPVPTELLGNQGGALRLAG